MKNYTILNAEMSRSHGYGQYRISVTIEFENNKIQTSYHSTDSKLWDDLSDADDRTETLLNKAKYSIERAVEEKIASL